MGRLESVLDRTSVEDRELVDLIKRVALPLREGEFADYDPLLEMIGDARIVLIGEASHGTHEFYHERARITTRLIRELGFSFVAIEGDWPEVHRVDQYVRGGPGTARDAMGVFNIYPTWMWGNQDALHFVEWLRTHNDSLSGEREKVGFYGLDLYSLFASIEAVVDYLQMVDSEAGRLARERYACFDPFTGNKDLYAYSAGLGITESCEDEAIAMLRDLQRRRREYENTVSDDSYFNAVMSAEVALDSERYYRSMYRGDDISWNLRDIHMQNTLDTLLDHHGPRARAIVWAHNTHIGDFRATADAGAMVNVGQLTRERHPGQSIAIGFGTYQGSVTASSGWGENPQRMSVPPAIPGSYDNTFHQLDMERCLLLLKPLRDRHKSDGLAASRGQRAIGVVYHPEYEQGNYVPSRLAERYDAYIHIDRSRAVKPLAIEPSRRPTATEETYPTGY